MPEQQGRTSYRNLCRDRTSTPQGALHRKAAEPNAPEDYESAGGGRALCPRA